METVNKQEYDRILSELDLRTTKFVALEQENQKILGDLQQVLRRHKNMMSYPKESNNLN
jgi:hypothetical protein